MFRRIAERSLIVAVDAYGSAKDYVTIASHFLHGQMNVAALQARLVNEEARRRVAEDHLYAVARRAGNMARLVKSIRVHILVHIPQHRDPALRNALENAFDQIERAVIDVTRGDTGYRETTPPPWYY